MGTLPYFEQRDDFAWKAVPSWMLLKSRLGNGEWGMGNGEWGMIEMGIMNFPPILTTCCHATVRCSRFTKIKASFVAFNLDFETRIIEW